MITLFLLMLAGDISPVGAAVEVESYRCEVTSSRGISCINIGRICTEARAKQKVQDDYYFGCALDDWKKAHPGKSCLEKPYHAPFECMNTVFGAW